MQFQLSPLIAYPVSILGPKDIWGSAPVSLDLWANTFPAYIPFIQEATETEKGQWALEGRTTLP